MSEDVTAFLERVYKLNEDEALDLIYGTVDDWMREGKADEATEALRLADVTRLSISGSLAFISITRSQGNFLSALDGRWSACLLRPGSGARCDPEGGGLCQALFRGA